MAKSKEPQCETVGCTNPVLATIEEDIGTTTVTRRVCGQCYTAHKGK